ncbi:hypothetical protein ABEO76_21275 [Bacillus anthracis]|uniref:hypothetical protein n=1 Tax=Bacillus anthracis TaxID=1392 RepID=UPI003D1F5EA9
MDKMQNFIVKIRGEYITSLQIDSDGKIRHIDMSVDMQDAKTFKVGSTLYDFKSNPKKVLEENYKDVGYEIIPVKLMVDYENPIFTEGDLIAVKFEPMVHGKVVSIFPFGNNDIRVELNTSDGNTHTLNLPPHMLVKAQG